LPGERGSLLAGNPSLKRATENRSAPADRAASGDPTEGRWHRANACLVP
jgi:hypothetical protein